MLSVGHSQAPSGLQYQHERTGSTCHAGKIGVSRIPVQSHIEAISFNASDMFSTHTPPHNALQVYLAHLLIHFAKVYMQTAPIYGC